MKRLFLSGLFAEAVVGSTSSVKLELDADVKYTQSDKTPYVCVTMDWWPNNKCDAGENWDSDCAWVNASINNAPVDKLKGALQALDRVTLRLGGTLADGVIYAVGTDKDVECPGFSPAPPETYRMFSGGCLTSTRWKELQGLCPNDSNCSLVFGLNAMSGRTCYNVDPTHAPCFYEDQTCTSDWNTSNVEAFVRANAGDGFKISGYEIGNELACLTSDQYAETVSTFYDLMYGVSKEFAIPMPTLSASDFSTLNETFLADFIPKVGSKLDSITWHYYPLGAGVNCAGDGSNNTSVDKVILDPDGLHGMIVRGDTVVDALASAKSNVKSWMGESGGAYNSGCNASTNAYMSGFWYLNALGGLALRGHEKFCRQTFVGGNYELVNKETLLPNPDYYTASLFARLMGSKVLSMSSGDEEVLTYAHCSREGRGATLAFLNFKDKAVSISSVSLRDGASRTVLATALDVFPREEYVLTGVDVDSVDYLHSNLVALNGVTLSADPSAVGGIPVLKPKVVSSAEEDLKLPAMSYGFISFPEWDLLSCK